MIYLDNAATTCPKPPGVAEAAAEAMNTYGNSGRGTHSGALAASRGIYGVRRRIAKLLGCPQADHVVYTAQQYTRGCMHRRNRYLVDNSGICVCYLTKERGGTAYTVNYAEKHKLEIINIAANRSEKQKP